MYFWTTYPFVTCLHWLPVPKWIEFKIATLTYQSVTIGQPTYLSALLTPYQPHRSLHSVSQNLLTVPRCNSSFGQRSFSYSAPTIWNGLPLAVRQSPSLHSFKRNWKLITSPNSWPPSDCLQHLWFDMYCRRSAPYKWLCMYVCMYVCLNFPCHS